MIVIDLEFQTSESASTTPSQAAKAATGTSLTAKDLAGYAGKYKMTGLPFEYIEIADKHGGLHMNAGGNEGDISPSKEADLFEGNGGTQLLFGSDAQKKVTTLTLKHKVLPLKEPKNNNF